ncbi:MAG: hypothetical protein WCT51_04510 [Candidatus Shapirobacteria bacterium]
MEQDETKEIIVCINNNQGGIADKDELNYMANTRHPGYMEALSQRNSAPKLQYSYSLFDKDFFDGGGGSGNNLEEICEGIKTKLKLGKIQEKGPAIILKSGITSENHFNGIGIVSNDFLKQIKEKLSPEFDKIEVRF